MRDTHRIAPAVALALLGFVSASPNGRAQALIGGNGFQNGFAINGLNNGLGGGFNGFAPAGFVGGPFNNGFGGFNNGNAFGLGFGGPAGGGMMMFSGPGFGFGGQPGFAGQAGFFPNAMVGGGMFAPQAFAMNNLGGVAAAIDQQVIRRPGQPLPAARRRRR
jgi:hypothetical protein